jgi:hypothetical protein
MTFNFRATSVSRAEPVWLDITTSSMTYVEQDKSETPRFRVEPLSVGKLLIPVDDVQAALDIAEGRDAIDTARRESKGQARGLQIEARP